MSAYVYAAVFAMVLWWFSTGIIMFLDNLPRRTFRWSMTGATVLMVVALFVLGATVNESSVQGAYLGFAAALLVWGWLEISFYMGYVTGPRRHACEPGCRGWRHFGHAIQVSLHHELAILLLGGLIVYLSWGAENQIGLWTFLVLALMHESARLNVFFGVRNLSAEFVPEHMAYLKSFLVSRPMNLFFPISITVSTTVLALLIASIPAVSVDPHQAIGLTLVSTMLALAVLEHWFLVLPIPAERLWHWSLKSRNIQSGVEGKQRGSGLTTHDIGMCTRRGGNDCLTTATSLRSAGLRDLR